MTHANRRKCPCGGAVRVPSSASSQTVYCPLCGSPLPPDAQPSLPPGVTVYDWEGLPPEPPAWTSPPSAADQAPYRPSHRPHVAAALLVCLLFAVTSVVLLLPSCQSRPDGPTLADVQRHTFFDHELTVAEAERLVAAVMQCPSTGCVYVWQDGDFELGDQLAPTRDKDGVFAPILTRQEPRRPDRLRAITLCVAFLDKAELEYGPGR